ncbi:MAG TPA: CotH kinase family protein [Tepidisphaeraceae bacterium]|nr:CotH kinase family protein [Tepidisphaeraceae bacterium]
MRTWIAWLVAWAMTATLADAQVVINEIFYRAPEDLDELEWVELYNGGQQAVDLSGWALKKGAKYTFPKDTRIEAGGYVVVCRNPQLFNQYYGMQALGGFDAPLSNKGRRIELVDAAGQVIDAVRYQDREPWPASADGYSASLERICPQASGEAAENWTASALSADGLKPAGTPGKQNGCYAAQLPPMIAKVTCAPGNPKPGEAIRIEAEVRDADGVKEVSLLYRVATPNKLGPETPMAMTQDSTTGRYVATIPAQEAGRLVRYRIKAVDRKDAQRTYPAENDLRPMMSLYVHEKYEVGRIPFGLILNVGKEEGARPQRRKSIWGGLFGGNQPPRTQQKNFGPPVEGLPPQGLAAFVYVDQKSGEQTVFDYVNITERSGGYKVKFHKDRPLQGMTAINLILEENERFVLNEALSYELFHRVGNAAPLTDFVRVWHDGRLLGYHLLIEQPNKAFLRRNKVQDDGNLYKLLWYGQGIVGQHEKKTNTHDGHEDLIALIGQLRNTTGDAQWKVIQENFNVQQVVTFFAVNMCLSDWDGFFNNYFTYHDLNGTKRWEMYPWDKDKTWGVHDATFGDAVFFNMPLTFGMNGDRAPSGGGPFGGGAWWRPGGYFSGPLLANPQFRKLFLARVKEICEKHYTTDVFDPIMTAMEKRLEEEVRTRAQAGRMNLDTGSQNLKRNMQLMRDHLIKRREFLLNQPEIKALDTPGAK